MQARTRHIKEGVYTAMQARTRHIKAHGHAGKDWVADQVMHGLIHVQHAMCRAVDTLHVCCTGSRYDTTQ